MVLKIGPTSFGFHPLLNIERSILPGIRRVRFLEVPAADTQAENFPIKKMECTLHTLPAKVRCVSQDNAAELEEVNRVVMVWKMWDAKYQSITSVTRGKHYYR